MPSLPTIYIFHINNHHHVIYMYTFRYSNALCRRRHVWVGLLLNRVVYVSIFKIYWYLSFCLLTLCHIWNFIYISISLDLLLMLTSIKLTLVSLNPEWHRSSILYGSVFFLFFSVWLFLLTFPLSLHSSNQCRESIDFLCQMRSIEFSMVHLNVLLSLTRQKQTRSYI